MTLPFFFRDLHSEHYLRLLFRLPSIFLPGLQLLNTCILFFRLLFRFSSVVLPGPCVFKDVAFWTSELLVLIFGHPIYISLMRSFFRLSYIYIYISDDPACRGHWAGRQRVLSQRSTLFLSFIAVIFQEFFQHSMRKCYLMVNRSANWCLMVYRSANW